MLTIRREFSGQADLEAMAALARAFSGAHVHIVDLPYRSSSGALDDPAKDCDGE